MLATMWFLSSVGTVVDSQCASLYKRLGASSVSTVVRAFIGVYAVVSLKIGLAIEALMKYIQLISNPVSGNDSK